MKDSTKLYIALGAGVVGIAAWQGYKYKQGAESLDVGLDTYTLQKVEGGLAHFNFRLKITNQTMYGYPVPSATVDFTMEGKKVGRAYTTGWQYIGGNGVCYINLIGAFDVQMIGTLLGSLYTTQKLPNNLLYAGQVYFGKYAIPFNSSYAIGSVFKKKIKKYWPCKDGFLSDHNKPGACNYHGGLKDKDNFVMLYSTPPGATKSNPIERKESSSRLSVNDMPISQINIWREKFQNRKTAYSEESVNKILAAVDDGTFNLANFDAVVLWKHPSGKVYMLSGHSRLEAFTRLCNSGKKVFCTIPAKFFNGSEAEAAELAKNSNTLSTKETDTERAAYYRNEMEIGKSYRDVIETAKRLEGNNAARILAYAFLNPIGKTFVSLQALEAGDPTSQTIIKAIAQWIGEARMKFTQLTDMHENELYNWLVNGGFGKQYKAKNDFLRKLAAIIAQRTEFGVFDASKPLNVANTITKSFAEKQHDGQVDELREKIADLDKQIKAKTANYKGRGANEAEIFKLLENDYGYLNRIRNQLLNLMQNKNKAIDASKSELALFAGKRANIRGIRPQIDRLFL